MKLSEISITPTTFSGTLYRGGYESEMPRDSTAWDVIQYEREELGNVINIRIPTESLKQIPSTNLHWLSTDRSYAEEFGEVEEVEGNFDILADDGDGGWLVSIQ